jgi:uncharacterized protein
MDKVVHFEIPAADLKRAKGFYKKVFGWKLTDFPEDDYVMVETTVSEKSMPKEPGAINGGLMKRVKAEKTPMIYMSVQSIEKTIKKVKAAGGKVVTPKTSMGDWGHYARIKDSEGNTMGLWDQ